MSAATDFNWVDAIPYFACAAGWLILMGVFLALLNHMVNKNDEKIRAEAAEELGKRLDRTSNGTKVHWSLDDPTPDEVDPPTTRPHLDYWERS